MLPLVLIVFGQLCWYQSSARGEPFGAWCVPCGHYFDPNGFQERACAPFGALRMLLLWKRQVCRRCQHCCSRSKGQRPQQWWGKAACCSSFAWILFCFFHSRRRCPQHNTEKNVILLHSSNSFQNSNPTQKSFQKHFCKILCWDKGEHRSSSPHTFSVGQKEHIHHHVAALAEVEKELRDWAFFTLLKHTHSSPCSQEVGNCTWQSSGSFWGSLFMHRFHYLHEDHEK